MALGSLQVTRGSVEPAKQSNDSTRLFQGGFDTGKWNTSFTRHRGVCGKCIRSYRSSESAPASRSFDFSQYVNENAGTLDLLKHHQVELIKFGVKFGTGAFTMYDLHEHKNPYPTVHDGQEYHGGLDGGIAPHGLSIASAANQLRVAYEHKQSNAQKQRYREHHGDIAQVLFTSRTQACMFT